MPIRYRYASKSDLENVLVQEGRFFTEKCSPPETIEGLELLLHLGGRILLQMERDRITGGIELLPIGNMDQKILSLPDNSPLRQAYYLRPVRYATDQRSLLVHGWFSNGRPAKWLYKELFRRYRDEMIGFVSVQNKTALRLYSFLGAKIIDTVPRIYSSNDAHCVLRRPEKEVSCLHQHEMCDRKPVSESVRPVPQLR